MKICTICENECDNLKENCPFCGGSLIDKKKENIDDTIINVAGGILDTFVAVDVVDTILDLIG